MRSLKIVIFIFNIHFFGEVWLYRKFMFWTVFWGYFSVDLVFSLSNFCSIFLVHEFCDGTSFSRSVDKKNAAWHPGHVHLEFFVCLTTYRNKKTTVFKILLWKICCEEKMSNWKEQGMTWYASQGHKIVWRISPSHHSGRVLQIVSVTRLEMARALYQSYMYVYPCISAVCKPAIFLWLWKSFFYNKDITSCSTSRQYCCW